VAQEVPPASDSITPPSTPVLALLERQVVVIGRGRDGEKLVELRDPIETLLRSEKVE
jgi:hypothetical protein